ncbi:uncharacterized protein K452DRAFT_288326 [Aplosporella prunicola CBS 121167]|uniref:Peptidase A1 domain-containing protein n=1 Tax=Aplosporella prunicola CBS 121167 TaxID=1176127 RepID=A0A6A6BCC8_9PEZI|nr:uncharacterized protein K452DRAFT_288326 [Aplosporella prunicola CBS 121167]KAF2140925.1 hypothetical protein K452DRAFT_288326 [Aplosporella prunicola CBS 121167]
MLILRIRSLIALSISFTRLSIAANDTNTPKPLSLAPTQYWDGNDGPWSTFSFTVGTPPQSLRLLPATGREATWPILPEGCQDSEDGNFDACEDGRGKLFYINESTSWKDEGLWELALWLENQLGAGEDARGHFGFDTVGLGWPSEDLPSLEGMVVGGIADKTLGYEGVFGLDPKPSNFSDLNNPQPSILHTLRNQTYIPSTSWAYTAGVYNNAPKVYGSLTLGGYDTARFEPNNLTFPFGPDISRQLLLVVQEVSTSVSDNPLMSTPDYWFIESIVSSMWFPLDVCEAFEAAFGITWDEEYSLYLISNETKHSQLIKENAEITFKLSASKTGPSFNLHLPYTSLALNASAPIYPNATRYFPLKRADNDTQYTLGRAFLQHAYVVVDYDRGNFSVAQARLPDISEKQTIVPIYAPVDEKATNTTTPNTDNTDKDNGSSGLSTGAIVGIVIGAIAALAILLALLFLLRRRRARARAAAAAASQDYQKAELDANPAGQPGFQPPQPLQSTPSGELDAAANSKHEMPGSKEDGDVAAKWRAVELESQREVAEMGAPLEERAELDASPVAPVEMPAGQVGAAELDGIGRQGRAELDGEGAKEGVGEGRGKHGDEVDGERRGV